MKNALKTQFCIKKTKKKKNRKFQIFYNSRLTSYIYEYLQQTGASKTAETFKEEVLSTNPAAGLAAANSTKLSDKSFLLEWWLLFWDLYSAAPERRDAGGDPFSAEAKYFHEVRGFFLTGSLKFLEKFSFFTGDDRNATRNEWTCQFFLEICIKTPGKIRIFDENCTGKPEFSEFYEKMTKID